MPVSNSFRCLCKFANRAAMHHKGNYIVPEGMSNDYRMTVDPSLFHLFLHLLLFLAFEVNVDEVLFFGEHVPYGNEYFACDGHLYFHFALFLDRGFGYS